MSYSINDSSICNSYGDIIWKNNGVYTQGTIKDFEDMLIKEYGYNQEQVNEAVKEVKSKGIVKFEH